MAEYWRFLAPGRMTPPADALWSIIAQLQQLSPVVVRLQRRRMRSSAADYTLTAADAGVSVDTSGGNRSVTLPDPGVHVDAWYVVRKAHASNTLTVTDGTFSKAWTANNESHIFANDGAAWFAIT